MKKRKTVITMLKASIIIYGAYFHFIIFSFFSVFGQSSFFNLGDFNSVLCFIVILFHCKLNAVADARHFKNRETEKQNREAEKECMRNPKSYIRLIVE